MPNDREDDDTTTKRNESQGHGAQATQQQPAAPPHAAPVAGAPPVPHGGQQPGGGQVIGVVVPPGAVAARAESKRRLYNRHTAAIEGVGPGQYGDFDENNPGVRVFMDAGWLGEGPEERFGLEEARRELAELDRRRAEIEARMPVTMRRGPAVGDARGATTGSAGLGNRDPHAAEKQVHGPEDLEHAGPGTPQVSPGGAAGTTTSTTHPSEAETARHKRRG